MGYKCQGRAIMPYAYIVIMRKCSNNCFNNEGYFFLTPTLRNSVMYTYTEGGTSHDDSE